MFKAPQFWHRDSFISHLLKPLSWIYYRLSCWKESHRKPYKVSVPVICVGNLVMGGAGKTPTVIAIVKILKEMGHQPHILSRGYGGYFRDVARVDASKHTYLQVGDEPLLLSAHAPTWTGVSRVAAAKAAIAAGATILVMDDGLQNSRLIKDYSLIVIDCIQGLGNNLVFPAGPLREPLQKGLKRAQAVLFVGDKENFKKPKGLSSFSFQYTARLTATSSLKPQPVVAFAGIGYPEKFRYTLEEQDFVIKDFVDFADHHPYTIIDMQKLERLAQLHDAPLITTEKDQFRIPEPYKNAVLTLPVVLQFDQRHSFEKALAHHFGLSPVHESGL
ncbi:tetraacyldisaccharide 4'-kinase [Candidatus Finniella inopinata]|uniref:tetraacyldisaccharide 4'-kinase n=1 Tax=Candidatus Finniella inopinata TaxID=1696036 RepID=UPI0013EE51F5|nr:tetraacyldisaccharide 4'-kinase [Candidatus Finniella inopinata]